MAEEKIVNDQIDHSGRRRSQGAYANVSRVRSGPKHREHVTPDVLEFLKTGGRRSHRRRSSRETKGKIRRMRLALMTLAFLLVFGGVSAGILLQRAANEKNRLVSAKQRVESDLVLARADLVRLQDERDQLVMGRLPGLNPIEYDVIIVMPQDFVRNISFTLGKQAREKVYEFRVVLANDRRTSVDLKVGVLLFDEFGIQIGSAEAMFGGLANTGENPLLGAGEVRSYSDTIATRQDILPKFFVLDVEAY